MQKLTLSIDDDLYALLHSQVGRGSIGRFISDAIRPRLHSVAAAAPSQAFGMLSQYAKPVTDVQIAMAKRNYMAQRYARKNAE